MKTSSQCSCLGPNWTLLWLCALMVSFSAHWVCWIWKRWYLHPPRCSSCPVACISQQPAKETHSNSIQWCLAEIHTCTTCYEFIWSNTKTHLNCTFGALLLEVIVLHHLSHDEAFFKVSVDLSSSLRSLGSFLLEQNRTLFNLHNNTATRVKKGDTTTSQFHYV